MQLNCTAPLADVVLRVSVQGATAVQVQSTAVGTVLTKTVRQHLARADNRVDYKVLFAHFPGESWPACTVKRFLGSPAGSSVCAWVHIAQRSGHLIAIRSVATARTLAGEVVPVVYAAMAIRARVIGAKVHLDVTAFSRVAAGAFAREATNVVDALTTVDARIRFALVVLEVAQLTGKSWLTETPETILLIDTDSVNARRGLAFVEVVLAKGTGVARSAIASKMSGIPNACSSVQTL